MDKSTGVVEISKSENLMPFFDALAEIEDGVFSSRYES